MPIYLEIPPDKSPTKLTDWIEINILLDADKSASAQDLKYILQRESEVEDEQIDEAISDQFVGQVFNEIENRQKAAKAGYPFKLVAGSKIKKKSGNGKYLPYIFCLLLSYFGPSNEKICPDWKTNKMAKKFEELSANAIEALLRNEIFSASVKVFGYPRKWKGKNANPRFVLALDKICRESGEMEPRGRKTAKMAKDGGLDVIAWKRFPDELRGGIVFAAQCGIGKNWDNKLHAIDDFFGWFIVDSTQKLQGIFIPHIPSLVEDEDIEIWLKYTLIAGALFSRTRIAFLARHWKDDFVQRFCEKALKNIRIQSLKDFQI